MKKQKVSGQHEPTKREHLNNNTRPPKKLSRFFFEVKNGGGGAIMARVLFLIAVL